MTKRWIVAVVMVLFLGAAVRAASAPTWTTEGPYVEASSFSFELPINALGTKLFVEVEVGGEPRTFVFDTGSPSMIRASLAEELGLEAVAVQQGTDAHGAVVKTSVVQTGFTLAGTQIHNVPAFVADFGTSSVGQCLMDGVLGSELLPLCAWQIDLPAGKLRCNTDLSALNLRGAERVRLYDFGFPHAPFLDVVYHKHARSKVMFDTGSPEYLAISPPDRRAVERVGAIKTQRSGQGSIGESLGGRAVNREHQLLRLERLAIDGVRIKDVDGVTRYAPPSLLGAGLLRHFVVTLSHPTESVYFRRYDKQRRFTRESFGLRLAFEDGVSVAFVWEGSPAHRAGLQVGQRLTTINGQATDASCHGIRRLLKLMNEADALNLTWNGGSARLERESILDSREKD